MCRIHLPNDSSQLILSEVFYRHPRDRAGPDVGTQKGKSTRRKPNQVVDASIELPDELMDIHDEVTVSLDGMEVNSLKFVTTIAQDLHYRTAQYISNP